MKPNDANTPHDVGDERWDEWARHYDNLLWTVTGILLAADGALLVHCLGPGNFKIALGLGGLFLTLLAMYFAASFRELRHCVGDMLESNLSSILSERRKLYQWPLFVTLFSILTVSWIALLFVNAPNFRTCWTLFGIAAVGAVLVLGFQFWRRRKVRTMNRADYDRAFGINRELAPDPKRGTHALELALDIRKFEIELYWKRATYFWAFLALTLASYFGLLTSDKIPPEVRSESLLIVSCLGVVFSVAWYFVNRGSKFWQENWEQHVALLEDSSVGPLYKTVLNSADNRFANLFGPFPFSVSRLNQILSLFVVLMFSLLLIGTLVRFYEFGWPPEYISTGMLILTACALWMLFTQGQGRSRSSKIQGETRTVDFAE